MVTGAALATINRLPVLLLPGDTFATRTPHPVLQQLEAPHDATLSVNDCFKPVSRYFDRIQRPEQLVPALLEAMRVLTDPAETGAVTLALPEDVQTEAFEVPGRVPRAARVDGAAGSRRRPRRSPARPSSIRGARRPLIVAGGGVDLRRGDRRRCARSSEATGIPVGETQAGPRRAAVRPPAERSARSARPARTAANRLAREADLVIGVGTRWSDFTTASKSAFQDPDVRFVNINVAAFDAAKHAGSRVVADARVALEALRDALAGHRADAGWERRAGEESARVRGRGRAARRAARRRAPRTRPR